MRHAALTYLGLDPSKPAVQFEIRLSKGALVEVCDTQIELHTDRNQRLAKIESTVDLADGRSVLKGGARPPHHRSPAGRQTRAQIRLRLPADPAHTAQFSPLAPCRLRCPADREQRRSAPSRSATCVL
jgi:hypothetical protein